MASDVTIRFRSFLPGSGHDSSGNAKQGKTRVVGQISITSYTRGGEALAPVDLGLISLDSVTLRCANEVAGPGGEDRRVVAYNQTDDLFYLVTISRAGANVERTSGDTETIEFVAEGDSAHDAELL